MAFLTIISLLILTGHQPQMAIRLIADVMNYTGFTVTVWSQSEDTAVNTGQLIIITAYYYGCQVSRKVLQMKTETCADKHLMALISLNWGQCSGIINEARFSFTAVAFVWEDWGHAWRWRPQLGVKTIHHKMTTVCVQVGENTYFRRSLRMSAKVCVALLQKWKAANETFILSGVLHKERLFAFSFFLFNFSAIFIGAWKRQRRRFHFRDYKV